METQKILNLPNDPEKSNSKEQGNGTLLMTKMMENMI